MANFTETEKRLNIAVDTVSTELISFKKTIIKKFDHLEKEHLAPMQTDITETRKQAQKTNGRVNMLENDKKWLVIIGTAILGIIVAVGGWFFMFTQNIPHERELYISSQLPAVVQSAIRTEFEYRDSLIK